MPRATNEDDAQLLRRMDDEFEDLLAKTRPYLLRLANASVEGRFCRAWLERLNKARDQRRLRNEHLAELLDQLERGQLKLPFDKMPPKHGRLVPIPRYDRYKQAPPPVQEVPQQQQQQQQVTSSSCTELTTEETGSVVLASTPAAAAPPQPVIPQSTSIPIATSKRSKSRHRASVSAGYVVAHSPSPNRSRLADNDDDDTSTLVDAPPIQASTVAGGDTSHPLPPSRSAATPRAAAGPPQTTTTTTTVHFCEQSVRAERNATRTYRERIETMSSIIEDLEAQNEKLREKLNYYHDCSQAKSEIPQLHAKIKKFVNEIATLRAKLAEVQEIKRVLEIKHRDIVEQYKTKMAEQFNHMKQQLENARKENQELNEKMAQIEHKLAEVSENKQEKTSKDESTRSSADRRWEQTLQTIKDEYEKMLREKDAELRRREESEQQKKAELERKSQEFDCVSEKVRELQQMLDLKSQDNLHSILLEQYKTIKEELHQMRGNLENVSLKQTDNHQQEIAALKKNVARLEKYTKNLQQEIRRER
ncbi:golgin subfamily A member 4-like isoform X3 [Trichogramma pretiosum]|uniref:golgin subfamily A member 4-like isoform X3 n=1 Tax=Trichogramma pretiosum TaxID=7493 RepID=UPI0006C94CD0|nr:golgin subfamily A member 4-like isoform X3 [Trichogramma pretiosum]